MIYNAIRKVEDGIIQLIRVSCGAEVIVAQSADVTPKVIVEDDTVQEDAWFTKVYNSLNHVTLPKMNLSFQMPTIKLPVIQFPKVKLQKVAIVASSVLFVAVAGGAAFSFMNSPVEAAVPISFLAKQEAVVSQNDFDTPSSKDNLTPIAASFDNSQKESDYVAPVAIPNTYASVSEDFYYINGVRIEMESNDLISDNYGF